MHKKGANITKIVRTINVSRDTIYKYLQERYPEQFKEVNDQTQKSQNQAQIKIQSQHPAQPQTQPAIITVKKVYTPTLVSVEGQESERLAKIMAKLNLSQALSEQEVKFLVKIIEQHKSFKNK